MKDTPIGQGPRNKARHGCACLMQHVRKHIEDGTWPPGHRLPAERELVAQFGIARNTLRKVMDQLEGKGLISRHVGRGTFVTDAGTTPVNKENKALLQRIYGASPADLIELRLLIEPPVVELAALRASGSDLQQIAHCLDEGEKTTTALDFEHWDGQLHQAILDAAHNPLLGDIYDAINSARAQPEWKSLKQRSLTPGQLARYRAQHRAIVQALRQRDANAAGAAMRQHLLAVRSGMIGDV